MHFLLGGRSPAWAGEVTRALLPVLPDATVTTVPGHGHDLVGTAPEAVLATLEAFLT